MLARGGTTACGLEAKCNPTSTCSSGVMLWRPRSIPSAGWSWRKPRAVKRHPVWNRRDTSTTETAAATTVATARRRPGTDCVRESAIGTALRAKIAYTKCSSCFGRPPPANRPSPPAKVSAMVSSRSPRRRAAARPWLWANHARKPASAAIRASTARLATASQRWSSVAIPSLPSSRLFAPSRPPRSRSERPPRSSPARRAPLPRTPTPVSASRMRSAGYRARAPHDRRRGSRPAPRASTPCR
jgi:hypothetical protein